VGNVPHLQPTRFSLKLPANFTCTIRKVPAAEPSSFVQLQISDGVAEIMLNRPPLNVLDIEMLRQINARLAGCASSSVRVVIIRSLVDRAFSAGVEIRDHTSGRLPAMLAEVREQAQRLLTLDAVTIAAIHGLTLGGGAELALLCDEVEAAEDTGFGFPEITLGAFPPIAAGLLPERSTWPRAIRLLFGNTVPAQTAKELGVVSEVVPSETLVSSARARARVLASFSGVAVRGLLRATRGARAAETMGRIDRAIEVYKDVIAPSGDAQEGIDAFVQKRKPAWSHR